MITYLLAGLFCFTLLYGAIAIARMESENYEGISEEELQMRITMMQYGPYF